MHKLILTGTALFFTTTTTIQAQMSLDSSTLQKIDSVRKTLVQWQSPASKVDAWLYLASSYIDLSQTDSAQHCLEKGFHTISQSPYRKGEYFLLSYQAELLDKNTLYDEALRFALKGKKLADSTGDGELIGNNYMLIGLIYNDSGQPLKAIPYLRRSLDFLPVNSHQDYSIARRQHSFLNLGQCYLKMKRYYVANYWLKKAIQESKTQHDYRVMAISYWLLGRSYDYIGNHTLAGSQYRIGVLHARLIHDWDATILFTPQLFYYYYRRNQTKKALFILYSGLHLVKEKHERIAMLPLKNFYVDLVAIYQLLNDYPKAIDAQQKVLDMNEQINRKANSQRLFLIQTFNHQETQLLKLNVEHKNQEILLRKNQSLTIILSISLALAAAIFGIIYYWLQQRRRYESIQQKQKVADLEQQRVVSTLKAVIEGEESERSRLAHELHNGVGSLLVSARHTLERHNIVNPSFIEPAPITLIDDAYEEVRRIAHNLMPHSLEHLGLTNALEQYCRTVMTSTGLTLTLQIYGLDERLERSIELWVYRIIQELVTNVLKHAKATRALVQLVYAGELLHITVEDNGDGFVATEALKKGSFGLRHLIDRTAYLKGTVTIESELGIGSSIVIELPVRPLTHIIE